MSKIIEKTKADKLFSELTCHIQQGYIPKLAAHLRWLLELRKLRSSEKVEILQIGLILRVA